MDKTTASEFFSETVALEAYTQGPGSQITKVGPSVGGTPAESNTWVDKGKHPTPTLTITNISKRTNDERYNSEDYCGSQLHEFPNDMTNGYWEEAILVAKEDMLAVAPATVAPEPKEPSTYTVAGFSSSDALIMNLKVAEL